MARWTHSVRFVTVSLSKHGTLTFTGHCDLLAASLDAHESGPGYVVTVALDPVGPTALRLEALGAYVESCLPITEGEC